MRTSVWTRAALALVTVVLAGCVTVRPVLDTPQGFAVYQEETVYRAVSPEGVTLRVRLVANKPPQTLDFWVEALKTQLGKSGYALTSEEPFETTSGKAVLLEWAAPVGEDDWIYLTGLAMSGERIIICEAAGEYELYRKHRQAILDSLGTVQVR